MQCCGQPAESRKRRLSLWQPETETVLEIMQNSTGKRMLWIKCSVNIALKPLQRTSYRPVVLRNCVARSCEQNKQGHNSHIFIVIWRCSAAASASVAWSTKNCRMILPCGFLVSPSLPFHIHTQQDVNYSSHFAASLAPTAHMTTYWPILM